MGHNPLIHGVYIYIYVYTYRVMDVCEYIHEIKYCICDIYIYKGIWVYAAIP